MSSLADLPSSLVWQTAVPVVEWAGSLGRKAPPCRTPAGSFRFEVMGMLRIGICDDIYDARLVSFGPL